MRNRIWDLCKILHNPRKVEMLLHIYDSEDGVVNVGELGRYMSDRGVKLSGVSQYLKQFEVLGLLMRERAGRFVFYHADMSGALREVREVARLVRARHESKGDMSFLKYFGVLMNPFRARLANYLYHGGDGRMAVICDRMNCTLLHFARDLGTGIELGMFVYEDVGDGIWHLNLPDDEIIRKVVEYSPWQARRR